MSNRTNEFARVSWVRSIFWTFSNRWNAKDILKASVDEKSDREKDKNIRDVAWKLDEMPTKTMSNVEAKSGCKMRFSTVATAEVLDVDQPKMSGSQWRNQG